MTRAEKRAQNNARDRFQYDVAKDFGIPFISWDGPALNRAKHAGAAAYTPAEFGESVIAFKEARDLFLQRLRNGLLCFLYEHGPRGHTKDNLQCV